MPPIAPSLYRKAVPRTKSSLRSILERGWPLIEQPLIEHGMLGLITVDLGSEMPPLIVEVTETTPAELGIAVGQQIFLVFKATSCRLYGEPERPA